jgi:2-amino-4-hydroxy-6-hydroxymethyldihydropteridine diphosphokinase
LRGRLTLNAPQRYLIALGSNMRVPQVGGPRRVLEAALAALEAEGLEVEAVSSIVASAPLGPSRRRYANAAAVAATDLAPPDLLALLQRIERAFGRRRRGRNWRARPLDLDIVLWSDGAWQSVALTIPHPEFRSRSFVLVPAAAIAPDWRDPVTGQTLRRQRARLTRPRPLPR